MHARSLIPRTPSASRASPCRPEIATAVSRAGRSVRETRPHLLAPRSRRRSSNARPVRAPARAVCLPPLLRSVRATVPPSRPRSRFVPSRPRAVAVLPSSRSLRWPAASPAHPPSRRCVATPRVKVSAPSRLLISRVRAPACPPRPRRLVGGRPLTRRADCAPGTRRPSHQVALHNATRLSIASNTDNPEPCPVGSR